MKCIILAAGYATRLHPLTENSPKPLLKVGDKSIIDWLIDDIEVTTKIDEYIVVSNHKYVEHFISWANSKDKNIIVLDDGTETNETRLGAVIDLQFAIDSLNICDDILVIAGDNVLDFSLSEFITYAQKHQTSAIMRYYEPDPKARLKSAVINADKNDLVTYLEEKPQLPKSNWCAPPFYYYVKEDLPLIKEAIIDGCGTDAPGNLVVWLHKHTKIHAMSMPGKRYDVGTLKAYNEILDNFFSIRSQANLK